jgi:hypothetical protein
MAVMRFCTALQVVGACLVVWFAGVLPASSSATQKVVLLYDERLDLPGLAALDTDLSGTLTSNSSGPIEVYREAMDLSRFGSNNYRTLLRDFLRSKYENKKIDLVIAVLGPALDFLLSNGDTIFPGIPIVFCGVDRRELGDRSLPPHVRGILLKREFARTLEIALRIHPQTKRVFVVGGTSEFDKRLLDQASNEFRVYKDRLAFTYLTELPPIELLRSRLHLAIELARELHADRLLIRVPVGWVGDRRILGPDVQHVDAGNPHVTPAQRGQRAAWPRQPPHVAVHVPGHAG